MRGRAVVACCMVSKRAHIALRRGRSWEEGSNVHLSMKATHVTQQKTMGTHIHQNVGNMIIDGWEGGVVAVEINDRFGGTRLPCILVTLNVSVTSKKKITARGTDTGDSEIISPVPI